MLFPLSHSTYTCTCRTLSCRREHGDNEAQFAFDVMFVELSVHLYLFALDALKARAGGGHASGAVWGGRAEGCKKSLIKGYKRFGAGGSYLLYIQLAALPAPGGNSHKHQDPGRSAAVTEAPSSPGPEKREGRGKTPIVRLYLSMALGPQVNKQPILSACLSSRVLVPKQKRTPVTKYETGKLTPKN